MKQKRKLPYVIAVDFDGTLCENKWPDIGMPNNNLISYLRCEQECKDAKIILWTCRHGRKLKHAVKWCKDQGLIFDAVNKNLPEVIRHFGSDTRKIFAHEYIDDKNTQWALPFKSDIRLDDYIEQTQFEKFKERRQNAQRKEI